MNRRIKRVNVSPSQIINILSESNYMMEDGNVWYINNYYIEGLPADYKVIGAAYDLISNSICVFIYSESFEEVPIYKQVPILEIETKVVTKEGKWRKEEPYKPLF